MKYLSFIKKASQYLTRPITSTTEVKMSKIGKPVWLVRTTPQRLTLEFPRKWMAESYQGILKLSNVTTTSKVDRLEVDQDTGFYVTYPKEDK